MLPRAFRYCLVSDTLGHHNRFRVSCHSRADGVRPHVLCLRPAQANVWVIHEGPCHANPRRHGVGRAVCLVLRPLRAFRLSGV